MADPAADPAETSMIGGPTDVQPARVLTSFETRCPRGTIIVAISGTANSQLQSIGPLTCSDGSSTGPLPVGFGLQSLDGKFTTRISPDGFTGMTVTAEYSVKSVSFYRQDQAFSATYGTMADVTTQFGRRQFLTCPNFGVAIGLVGIKAVQTGVPVMLGLICSNLPCPVRTDTIFGPPGAPQIPSSPGSYLGNSPEPVQTTTATQCCSICTRDFRCEYWVRDDRSGSCWRVYREPFQAGAPLPGDWTYQAAPGFSAGPTTPKTSGVSVCGAAEKAHGGGAAAVRNSRAERGTDCWLGSRVGAEVCVGVRHVCALVNPLDAGLVSFISHTCCCCCCCCCYPQASVSVAPT